MLHSAHVLVCAYTVHEERERERETTYQWLLALECMT